MNKSTAGMVAAIVAAGSDERTLWSIVALLAVIGVALAMLAVALVRWTRPDRELLAPLEVMGRRKWRRSDPVWQHRQLDAVRPPGAQPLTSARATPVRLEGFEQGPAAGGFDDLIDTGVDDDLTELPGGVVFDSDPTPPPGDVPVVTLGAPAADVPLSQLGIDWGAPSLEDLAIAADHPVAAPTDEPPDVEYVPDAPADDDDTAVVIRPPDTDEPVEQLDEPAPLDATDEPVASLDAGDPPPGDRPYERRE